MSKHFDVGFARQAHNKYATRVAELEAQLEEAQRRLKGSTLLNSSLADLNSELDNARAVLLEIESTYEWRETLRKDREYEAEAPAREIARLRQERIEREGREFNALVARVENIRGWKEAGVHSTLEKIQLATPFFSAIDAQAENLDKAASYARLLASGYANEQEQPEMVTDIINKEIQKLVSDGRIEVSVQNERTRQLFLLTQEPGGLQWVDRDTKRNITRNLD